MQGRITDLHMKEDSIELTGIVRKLGPIPIKRLYTKRNIATCAPETERNKECDNVDCSFSFPMSQMKRIATQTIMEKRTVEINIPGTAERLDRVHMVKNRSRNILKND